LRAGSGAGSGEEGDDAGLAGSGGGDGGEMKGGFLLSSPSRAEFQTLM